MLLSDVYGEISTYFTLYFIVVEYHLVNAFWVERIGLVMTYGHESPILFESAAPNQIGVKTINEFVGVASASFGRAADDRMRSDIDAHITGAHTVGIARVKSMIVGVSMARVVDDLVFDWMGCIIHPDYQRHHLATQFMAMHLDSLDRYMMMGHTRTPRVIALIRKWSDSTYPIDDDPELREIAHAVEHVTIKDDVPYHVDRYAEDGLYGNEDPADEPLDQNGPPLKVRYPGLYNPRSAIVLVARFSVDGLLPQMLH